MVHSSVKLTMGQYAHAVPENDGRAAEIIGNQYSPAHEASKNSGHRDYLDGLREVGSPYQIRTGDLRLERAAS